MAPRNLLPIRGYGVIAVLFVLLLLAACSQPAPAPTPASPKPAPAPAPSPSGPAPSPAASPTPKPTPAAWKWPPTLSIGSSSVGSANYTVSSAWAPVMEAMTGMKVRIVPESNGPTREGWLKAREIDLASTTVQDIANVIEASSGFASKEVGSYPLRVVWINSPNPQAFVTRGDSNIKTIYDIKAGTRIAYFTVPSAIQAMDGLLAWVQVPKKDIQVVEFGSFDAAVRAIGEGKADVGFSSLTSPVIVEVASGPRGVRVLETDATKDPQGAARMQAIRTTATFGPATTGIKEGIGKVVWYAANFYEARADTSTDLIYNIAKWLGENFDAYKDKNVQAQTMTINDFMGQVDLAFLPLHDGTVKYLKEKGKWTQAHEARQKYNVELANKYVEAYKAAMDKAQQQGIQVDPTNKTWTDFWAKYAADARLPRVKAYMEVPK